MKTKKNNTIYLCAYYALRKRGKFRDARISFPSHRTITETLQEMSLLSDKQSIEFLMEHLGIPYSVSELKRHRGEKIDKITGKNTKRKSFLNSKEWQTIRYEVLVKQKATCQCCGRTRKDGVVLHVDHIKPRSIFPGLALDINNLQVLCEDCNLGKSNITDDDWR